MPGQPKMPRRRALGWTISISRQLATVDSPVQDAEVLAGQKPHDADQPLPAGMAKLEDTDTARDEDALLRRLPSVQELLSWLTILGIVLYAFTGATYLSLYGSFGVGLTEVGVEYGNIIGTTGILMAYAALLAILLSLAVRAQLSRAGISVRTNAAAAGAIAVTGLGLFIVLTFGLHDRDWGILAAVLMGSFALLFLAHMIRARIKGWSSEAAAILMSTLSLCLYFLSYVGMLIFLITSIASWGLITIVGVIGGLTIGFGRLLRGLPRLIWALILTVAAVNMFVVAVDIGDLAAKRYEKLNMDIRQVPFVARAPAAFLLGETWIRPVCAKWTMTPPPAGVNFNHELLYLGKAEGTVVLYDTKAQNTIRVPSEAIVLTEPPSPKTTAEHPWKCA